MSSSACLKVMDKEASLVLQEICSAFKRVTLGQGIGLREGNGLDDFYTEEACAELRLLDEKENWLKLESENLNEYWSSLSHFDCEGMRFHLPAFLKCDLEEQYEFSLISPLVRIDEYRRSQYALLNKKQKQAVVAYLVYKISSPRTFDNDIPEIHKAIAEYWLVEPDEAELN